MAAHRLSLPKINLYRRIALVFVVGTLLLVATVFLAFYNKATVVVSADKKDIDLSFNVELKANPSEQELAEKDMVSGKLLVIDGKEKGTFEVATTKTVDSTEIGQVRLVNNSSRPQPLLKTTQLQASSGTIVRTSSQVVVPAGGSVLVNVYPADPQSFTAIEPGKLTIIKLNKGSQDKIYGLAENKLIGGSREVKVLSDADLKKAKEELVSKLSQEIKKNLNLQETDQIEIQTVSFKTDRKIGEVADKFNLEITTKAKTINLDYGQLANLLGRKIDNLDLSGFSPKNLDFTDFKYSILDENLNGSVLIKTNYTLKASLDSNNQIFAKENFTGKTVEEVKDYLGQYDLIKNVEVMLSPFWSRKLPRTANKIKVIIQ